MHIVRGLVPFVPTLLALLFAARLLYINMTGELPLRTLVAWSVVLLLLLIVNELTERVLRISRIEKNVDRIAELPAALESGILAKYFLRNRDAFPPIDERLRGARTVWLLGASLEHVTYANAGTFIEAINRGSTIRFLLLNPQSSSVAARAFGLFQADTGEALRKDIERTFLRIEEMRNRSERPDCIEVRVTDYVPSYGMMIVDSESSTGEIVVELYPYEITSGDRPHFELRPQDGHWYDYFNKQFKAMWEDSEFPPDGAGEAVRDEP